MGIMEGVVMESILQHWAIWAGCLAGQITSLGVVHVLIRQKINVLDYWVSGAMGIAAWLVPLLIVALALGQDPRPTLLIVATTISMIGGIAIETRARRQEMRAVLFYIGLVLTASVPAWTLGIWMAQVPPPGSQVWIEQIAMGVIGILVVGALTVLLHYSEMLDGADLYRREGLTPCEQRTVADAVYIINRKLRPHLGDVLARMKRANEALQAGMANMTSIDTFLSLIVAMLDATVNDADEAFVDTLRHNVKTDSGLRVAAGGDRRV
jgi:hypothetical protein